MVEKSQSSIFQTNQQRISYNACTKDKWISSSLAQIPSQAAVKLHEWVVLPYQPFSIESFVAKSAIPKRDKTIEKIAQLVGNICFQII